MRTKPQLELTTVVVRGDTQQEALANVKRRYGPQAAIVESREVRERSQDTLEERRVIEVVVALDFQGEMSPQPEAYGLSAALAHEIVRIEDLVTSLEVGQEEQPDPDQVLLDSYPLASGLLRAGVGRPATLHLARQWRASTVDGVEIDARRHIMEQIHTSRGGWTNFGGCHVLIGESGSGRTALCMGVARELSKRNEKVLVLMVGTRNKGEIRLLQEQARVLGVDAAILRQGQELVRAESYFSRYSAVLIDTPAVGPSERQDSSLHRALAENERYHRHLIVPVDADAGTDPRLWKHARDWSCDWVALTRSDLAARPGRVIEIAMASPCPLSMQSSRRNGETSVEIVTGEMLINRLLGKSEGVKVRPQDFAAKAVEV